MDIHKVQNQAPGNLESASPAQAVAQTTEREGDMAYTCHECIKKDAIIAKYKATWSKIQGNSCTNTYMYMYM